MTDQQPLNTPLAFTIYPSRATSRSMFTRPPRSEMESRKAYVTLLTNSSYFPAALVLSESLKRVGSKYPLVVMSTPSLASDVREALTRQGLEIVTVDPLLPSPGTHTLSNLDVRFADTWTKLRCVKVPQPPWSTHETPVLQGIWSGGL